MRDVASAEMRSLGCRCTCEPAVEKVSRRPLQWVQSIVQERGLRHINSESGTKLDARQGGYSAQDEAHEATRGFA